MLALCFTCMRLREKVKQIKKDCDSWGLPYIRHPKYSIKNQVTLGLVNGPYWICYLDNRLLIFFFFFFFDGLFLQMLV